MGYFGNGMRILRILPKTEDSRAAKDGRKCKNAFAAVRSAAAGKQAHPRAGPPGSEQRDGHSTPAAGRKAAILRCNRFQTGSLKSSGQLTGRGPYKGFSCGEGLPCAGGAKRRPCQVEVR